MMPMHTVPEIQRSSLAAVVLTLKCLGVEDVLNFDYLDPPEEFHLLEALRRLYFFDALDRAGNVTLVGRLMSNFPLSPSLARVLLTALETNMPERYTADLVGVVAMLSCEEPYIRPRELYGSPIGIRGYWAGRSLCIVAIVFFFRQGRGSAARIRLSQQGMF